jgi:hypothetical protein
LFRNLAKLLIANLIAVTLVAFAPAALVQPAAATGGFQSTLGQEFWVNFDQNHTLGGTPKIYLSGAQNANVTITWPDQTTEQATVTAFAVTTVDATTKISTANKYTTQTDGVSQTAVKIVSDAAISVYILNQKTSTSDASQAYPSSYQGFEYFVLNSNNGQGRFSVIANETGTTTVTITPRVTLGSRTAGVAYTQTLQQGDVYSLSASADMRGTKITSDKRITVTSSNNCVNLGFGACDHITEYIPPVTTWGKSFVVPATQNTFNRDRIVVMAGQANTAINVNGVASTLALAGDHSGPLALATLGETTVITADKPVLVMQFLDAGTYTNGTSSTTGDPAMVVITPVVQYLNDVVITTPATGFTVNQLSLVVAQADVGTITFNGTPIASGLFEPAITLGSDTFRVVKLNLALGAHRITSTNGFGVLVYGYNPADSYAYAGAGGMVDLVQYPGGVAQVGYVAANLINTPQQQSPPQAPAQVVAPPSPAIFFNRSIPAGTTGTIRLSGVNLTGLTSLKIGDKTVEIVSSGDGFAEIKLPELAAGVYNFFTTGTRTEGAWIGTQQLVLTVVAAAANPNPGGLKSATFTITNFVGGSAVLTSAMKARIAAEVAKHGGVKSSACVGATSGPTILSVDASLAQRRAVAVCQYIATLTPQVITTTTGKNTLLPGGSARKVTVTLRF